MKNEIQLIKNNDKRDWSDIEWIKEFYRFLQGEIPSGMRIKKSHRSKLTDEQAFTIIWYLQEHFSLLPDHIERCDHCGELYDSWSEGLHVEKPYNKMHSFCDSCTYLVPEDHPIE